MDIHSVQWSHGSQYADVLSTYDRIPKAVLAAIAVSYGSAGGDNLQDAEARVLEEWRILHENGIVPQAPPR
jgi:hypothetical protein